MKVLEFFGEPLSYGGQEAFILNMYENFKKQAEYMFVTPFYANNKILINLIKKKKDKCIAYNFPFDSKLRKKYIVQVAKTIITNRFDVIHIHSGSIFTLLIVSYIARKRKVKKIIVHSHATGNKNFTHKIIKIVSDRCLNKYADYFLACSKDAGEFKFSKEIICSDHFHIIKNGIDIEKYKFNIYNRQKIRKELKIEGKYVICNIGRYSPEKNHKFLIDVFNEYKKIDKNAILLLVGGKGISSKEVLKLIEIYQLSSQVIMLTDRSDINEILSAVDVFLFPSLFEGLGISAIEAQAAGLDTICSEYVPNDVAVSHLYHKLFLHDGARKWAEYINSLVTNQRSDVTKEILASGYSAVQCSEKLENLYFYNI